MADTGAIFLAKNLLEEKVLLRRPPSGSRAGKACTSAYARELSSTTKSSKLFQTNHSLPPRPATKDGKQTSDIKNMYTGMKKRIQSAHPKLESSQGHSAYYDTGQDSIDDRLKPNVYSLSEHKKVFGSNSDLITEAKGERCPYKLETSPREFLPGVLHKPCARQLPSSLKPLAPWLTPEIPPRLIGMSPRDGLIFLPGFPNDYEDLPTVPPVQNPEDDLPYKSKVKEPEPWAPKRYRYYRNPTPVLEDWMCKHAGQRQVKVFAKDGTLLHERFEGKRTADVVRKEIQELEDLMRGIGTEGGTSIVVQYQAEITKLKEMVDDTLARVIHRDTETEPEPTDYCGLRKFYKHHDAVMDQIKKQHELCVQELAELESDMEMEDEKRYFSKSVMS
ncbi:uncharacterized protein LOC106172376 isoform X1 [Lingula anatina]|uniref:Uncharacterized protein LOC106172376 isoform X1 n=1 Tax=Lingula anatina TaxID=7574 RepID=A0A1S3JEB1_LINAN|nr:uncharacterized protein LOC106172376 isoform X1 [Lingula anatina]|eukprot:XP_013408501.1 uncharacterized protein LOC106172376 isoform X1 [Lingula anatina]